MESAGQIEMKRPFLVRCGLGGLKSRNMAIVFLWLSVALGVASLFFKLWTGGFLFVAVAWYWFAIRWVDNHGGWE